MRTIYFKTTLVVALVLVVLGCEKSDLDLDASSCIESKIRELKRVEVQNPPAQVWKWEADGNILYYFTSDCCDQYNYLYNENCEIVCAPDGGITGNGDGNCPVFTTEIEKTLIWEDQRD